MNRQHGKERRKGGGKRKGRKRKEKKKKKTRKKKGPVMCGFTCITAPGQGNTDCTTQKKKQLLTNCKGSPI